MDAGDREGRGRPAHSSRPLPRFNRIAAGVGGGAALLAVAVGTAALVRSPGGTASGPRTLDAITVSAEPTATLPMTGPEILALLDRGPEYGALADPARRIGCLAGLGYPASTRVLGAREVEIRGHPGVVLVLAGEQTGSYVAVAVSPTCSSADTGLLADTTVRSP